MILYSECYEREGNDAWLEDSVQVCRDTSGLYLLHQKRWIGWAGDINEDNKLELDETDLLKSQKILNKYIEDNSLYTKYPSGKEEGFIINLQQLL